MLLAFLLGLLAISVPTAQYDNSRLGSNSSESILKPGNVNNTEFGFRNSYPVDGAIFAQPLYVEGVTIGGLRRNILIVVTMHDSIYAFDADSPSGIPLWSNLAFDTSNTSVDSGANILNYSGEVGCLSTPVVDQANSVIYAVCSANTSQNWKLRKFSLTDGTIAATVTISGQYAGTGTTGDTVTSGNVQFRPSLHFQRAPVTLSGGLIYVAFASVGDITPWHGWIFSYNSSLVQQAAFMTTPNGNGGGIWEAGGGITVDGSGNLYVATGNGDFSAASSNFSQTVIKLTSALVLSDWFTPSDNATTSGVDADLSSGRIMLIPGTTLLTLGSKDFRVWVIDTADMGHLQGTGTAPQVFNVTTGTINDHSGVYGGMWMNNVGYFPIVSGHAYAFNFSGSTFTTTAAASTTGTFSFPGAVMTGSSLNGANPIIWAVTASTGSFSSKAHGTLRAFDTSFTELWNSDTNIGNSMGTIAKYAAPVVVDGRVYVASVDHTVYVYGLIPSVRSLALP